MTGAVDRFGGYNGDLAIKAPVKAATTANITLSGEQTIDGIVCVSGDRVLATAQTTGNLNGVYIVSTSTWTRAADFDGARDIVKGTCIPVNTGATYGAKFLQITTADPIIIGTTSLAFSIADISGSAANAALALMYANAAAASAVIAQANVGNVKVTASDTTSAPLNSTLTSSGSIITKTVVNPGADETLDLNIADNSITVQKLKASSILTGFANFCRNATKDIAQRGISGSVNNTTAYGPDGFMIVATGAQIDWFQSTEGNGQAYSIRLRGNTSLTNAGWKYRVESYRSSQLVSTALDPIIVQHTIFNNTGASVTPVLTVKRGGALDDFSSPVTEVSSQSTTAIADGTFGTVAFCFTPTTLGGRNGYDVEWDYGAAINANTKNIYVYTDDIRSVVGATPGLITNPPIVQKLPVGLEEADALRYFRKWVWTTSPSYTVAGQAVGTTSAIFTLPLSPPMRKAPTGITVSANSDFQLNGSTGTGINVTGISFVSASPNEISFSATVASGLTAGNATYLRGANASGASLQTVGGEL